MKTWTDHIRNVIGIFVTAVFVISVIYTVIYIREDRAILVPREEVTVIKDWTYIDQLTGPRRITTPVKVDREGRDVFIFESTLPDTLCESCIIAFLCRVDMKVEVDGHIIREWKRDDAPIVGRPAKNSYFIIPVEKDCAGGTIRITIDGEDFGGKFFDVFVGDRYEVVRFLEIKSGAVQFGMSLALLVCSMAIVVAGYILRIIFRHEIKLTLLAMGIFVVSSWMVTDSFVFQFLFRTQFIDGLMSYMTTLVTVFPFLFYLDSIQNYRYKKWYMLISIFEVISLIVFSGLHFSNIVNFSQTLLQVDAAVGLAVLGSLIITVVDVARGNSGDYRYVSYGFLIFMVLSLVEIVLINTVVERVEGGVMIAGLYILFAFGIIQQLSEIRALVLERDRANAEGAAKTKFLAGMSHEIRTPINSILGMNEMILRESRDPNIANYAGIINESGTMLLSLINDILDVSKIDNDMEEIISANYDPEKMFENLANILRTQAAKKDLTAKIGKPQNLPKYLCGDEKRISQMVINLITNAVKYTEEGTVTFTGECFYEEATSGYTLCFYVSDTGIGIKKEDIDSIFDPFHRLDLKKNQSIQGTGLGLSIVKNLVEKMGGEVKVESVYGKGSTFSVRIPQQAMKGIEDETYNSGNSVEDEDLSDIDDNYIAPEARVLEVDDNLSNQIVVREFLKKTGITLDLASGGMEALRLCKVNKYDVILMDHMMPAPDGIETMHLIRTDEGSLNKMTPQIVLTANAIRGSKAKYEAEGFDNYLSKPVESVRLIKMVRKYLPPEKVLYKPKSRTAAGQSTNVQTSAHSVPEGPVDITALLARFDNKEETVNLILQEVIKEGERKIPLLKQLVEEENIKNYAVEAHGIKGVMASSCVPSLSATAKSHELAAKEGNFKYVKDNVDGFIKEYEEVLDFIRQYLGSKGQ
ncbi:MAG: response regulator [Lachnospiraceae bacterium]|nr:response regulator [Lachnospiraceae bacterium]